MSIYPKQGHQFIYLLILLPKVIKRKCRAYPNNVCMIIKYFWLFNFMNIALDSFNVTQLQTRLSNLANKSCLQQF